MLGKVGPNSEIPPKINIFKNREIMIMMSELSCVWLVGPNSKIPPKNKSKIIREID